jgi:hypothetical protein
VTPEERTLRDAYLAELWPTCREVSRDVRAGWAAVAASAGYVSCHSCGVVFRQPKDAAMTFRWCPECAVEVAS